MKELDIGEVARISGVAPSTLRFYEKKGLIRPVGRYGLRRQYRENVLTTLAVIALGRTAGFSLDDIAAMLDTGGKVQINRQLMLNKADEIDNTIRQLEKVREGLKHVAHCPAPDHLQCPEFIRILHATRSTEAGAEASSPPSDNHSAADDAPR